MWWFDIHILREKITTIQLINTGNISHKYISLCVVSQFSSFRLLSHVQLFVTPWTAVCQTSLSITNSRSLLKLMSWVGDAIQPSHPLSPLLLLPSTIPSIRVFSNESVLHIRLPKYWSFSFSISLSNEYSGLVSFRMDWLDLLEVQGTLKSLLQHHSSKASVCSCLENLRDRGARWAAISGVTQSRTPLKWQQQQQLSL